MNVELQNQVVGAIKEFAWGLGLDEYVIVGLSLVRSFSSGRISVTQPELLAAGAMLAGKMMGNLPVIDAVIKQLGVGSANERTLRLELEKLTDAQGVSLCDQVKELATRDTAIVARHMKSYSQTLDSPPGQLAKLSTAQRREICETILDLQRKGFTLAQAKKRVVGEFAVRISGSTVNRVWADRAKLFQD